MCAFVKGRFREILIQKRILKRMINPVIINRFSMVLYCGQSRNIESLRVLQILSQTIFVRF